MACRSGQDGHPVPTTTKLNRLSSNAEAKIQHTHPGDEVQILDKEIYFREGGEDE